MKNRTFVCKFSSKNFSTLKLTVILARKIFPVRNDIDIEHDFHYHQFFDIWYILNNLFDRIVPMQHLLRIQIN